MGQNIVVHIEEDSNVGELRRVVIEVAKSLGFDQEHTGRLAIIANEMSTNILKHAKSSGKVAVRKLIENGIHGIEIIAMDSGLGIKNIGHALKDGFSTTESMGTGLGAIKRLSDVFDIYSQPEKGTLVLSRVWNKENIAGLEQSNHGLDYGVFSLAKPGQEVCGDGWFVHRTREEVLIFVSDGLGHGEEAAKSSRRALKTLRENIDLPLEDLMRQLHEDLKGSRGAAISIAKMNQTKGSFEYIGVGNVSGRIFYHEKSQSCISNEGIVGANLRKVQSFTYDFPESSIFILYTDGFISSIFLDQYPGILNKQPSLIAALLYRDFSRGNDDMAVAVLKNLKRR